jgi:hypothetical protein
VNLVLFRFHHRARLRVVVQFFRINSKGGRVLCHCVFKLPLVVLLSGVQPLLPNELIIYIGIIGPARSFEEREADRYPNANQQNRFPCR